ncbi:MAG: FG-GAP-like repeat-containing protein [Verrucomicrobiota bacterium]
MRTALLGFVLLLCKTSILSYGQSWSHEEGYDWAPIPPQPDKQVGFSLIKGETAGVNFTNNLDAERGIQNQILLNGSGVAAGDVNGDGWCDLYFCCLDSPNKLFLGEGNWHFKEQPNAGGAACIDQSSTGAMLADMDGDQDLDLLVTGHRRGVRLFLNDGTGAFTENTDTWHLKGTQAGASMALADVDGSGWLDLYVVHYRNETMRDMPPGQFDIRMENGAYKLISFNGQPSDSPELKGRFTFDRTNGVLENGQPDQLYLHTGKVGFEAVSWETGSFLDVDGNPASTPFDWGLSAMFRDTNGDGAPDLYVCNDFQSPDRLWINQGKGRFKEADNTTLRQTSLFSMGLDFADIDRNGLDDLFVADMLSRSHKRRMVQVMDGTAFSQFRDSLSGRPQSPRNTLLLQQNDGTFAELARYAGVEASEWSWCPVFLDVDLDGYEDLLITTGHWRDAQNADVARQLDEATKSQHLSHPEQIALRKKFPILYTPNVAFRNNGDGTFTELGSEWGFDATQVSHGMALADLDNDGDLDAVVNCLNHAPLIYRNNAGQARIRIQLKGTSPNTQGIGAKMTVQSPGLPIQTQTIMAGGRYLSSDQATRTFAIQSSSARASIEVLWPNGVSQRIENLAANRIYNIIQASGSHQGPHNTNPSSEPAPFFEDVSSQLNHQHVEAPHDDFQRQALQPRKMSRLGPGIAWFDFNQDGWEDLFIGGSKGGKLGVYRNDSGQRFVRQRAKAFETPLAHDQTTVLAWKHDKDNIALIMGQSSTEATQLGIPAFTHFSMVTGKTKTINGNDQTSIGPMSMADVDGDGDLDLFVGGRMQPGRFPDPPDSFLYRNDGGNWILDRSTSELLKGLGQVSAAGFSDLLGDHLPELIVACDWGTIHVFENEQGVYKTSNITVQWPHDTSPLNHAHTLDALTGWWTSLTTMDADGDGRMDIVAGNWGCNHEHAARERQPLQIHFGGPSGPGGMTVLESCFDPPSGQQVPIRDWGTLSAWMPWLSQSYTSFGAFADASLEEILSVFPFKLESVQAGFFESTLLLNRGESFIIKPLPKEAQYAPVFGLGVGDFNGDGCEDLILSQNFFDVSALDSRQDAGQGALLFGQGDGSFKYQDAQTSGIRLRGEGRGLAVADFNHDRRPDFVAVQNNASTLLYQNQSGKPGIAIRLTGSPHNLQAIGTKMRLIYADDSKGPARELHLGDGYWSQSPNRQILGHGPEVKGVLIEWPDGQKVEMFDRNNEWSFSHPQ